jgi:amino acid permease
MDEKKSEGLKTHKLTFWEGAMTIVGANIGAGVLGLAYSARLAGWPVLVFWLIVAGFFTTCSMLYVAESALRTEKNLQLPGLAQKYVGNLGSWAIFFSVAANAIGCLISYTSGSGAILNELFGIPVQLGSIIFSIPAVIVVYLGLKATGVGEKIMSFGMIALLIVIVIASLSSGKVNFDNVTYTNWRNAVPLFNVALFCYIAQYSVPELARGMRHIPEKLAPSIITGMFITFLMLCAVPFAVLSLTGPEKVTEVATIAWGRALGDWALFVGNIFALCAMMTSYWAVGGSFVSNIVDKFNLKNENDTLTRLVIIAIVVLPAFYLAYSGKVSFVDAIYLAGTFGGVVMSIVPVLMIRGARKNGDREPEWTCGFIAGNFVQTLLIVIFCAGAIYAILSMMGLLPAGW